MRLLFCWWFKQFRFGPELQPPSSNFSVAPSAAEMNFNVLLLRSKLVFTLISRPTVVLVVFFLENFVESLQYITSAFKQQHISTCPFCMSYGRTCSDHVQYSRRLLLLRFKITIGTTTVIFKILFLQSEQDWMCQATFVIVNLKKCPSNMLRTGNFSEIKFWADTMLKPSKNKRSKGPEV